jgi:two-component system response regulator YesN
MYSVLLVDDEPRAIEGLQYFIEWEKLGFNICGTCETGEDALGKVASLSPDLVVTDICMPEMDGLELIRHLRESQAHRPEFIVLSGFAEFNYAKRALQLGVVHYLLKPVVVEEASDVLQQVRNRLDQKRAESGEPDEPDELVLPIEVIRSLGRIMEAIERLDPAEAEARIRHLLQEFPAHNEKSWERVLVSHLAIQCAKLFREMGGNPEQLPLQAAGTDGALAHSAAERMLACANQTIRAIRGLEGAKQGGTLAEVDRHVREHFRSPLTVRKVAEQFYLHPVYLGKAYQDKFGVSLLERMHDLRIEEARRLLRETDLNAGTVASRVGYAQYHHFLQHFEKRTGMKPAEYKARFR